MEIRLLIVGSWLAATLALAQDPPPGHSHQGPAFDQGPRQFATLESGMPDIEFDTPGCTEEANRFIRQGIGQLHGFLNFESERSFRHAAFLDKNCVFAYWGMGMSSAVWVGNTERAKLFAGHARSRLNRSSSEREQLYVRSLEFLAFGQTSQHLATLQSIFTKYPNDLEAKAFYIVNYWISQRSLGLNASDQTVLIAQSNYLHGLAKEILSVKPLHPVHHYVIHMWDSPQNFSLALDSADKSGFSGPSIAHLWHMSGHIYSRAKMPFEMWWAQEAAARVDHSYMERKKVFPYWLHNHAHNNEWLSRTLMDLGNLGKAKAYALNMLAQPRHPTLNRINQYQHVQTGVLRSAEVLERGEYWPEAAALFDSPFMNCNEFTAHRQAIESCRRMKAITAVMTGNLTDNDLNGLTSSVRSEALALRKILNNQGRESALQQLSNLPHLKSGWALSRLIRYAMYAERSDLAADWSAKLIAEDPKNTNFRLLAAASHALSGRTEQARKLFESLKKVSQELDEEAPFNKSMIEILRSSGLINEDSIRQAFAGWRPIHSSRPLHDNLGPVLWQPIKIPNLQWTDSDGTERSLDSLVPGKPAVIALVLGNCPRCDTQFALLEEKRAELNAKGIELIAIASTPVNLPVFKQMWSFDEFESIPIHGLFVVNSDREVVWQDVSAEAFLDIDFLMNELPRVLSPIQRSMIRGSISK